LLVVVAPFSSGDIVIRYILPVLWMTSCFHIIGSMLIARLGHYRILLGGHTLRVKWNHWCAAVMTGSARNCFGTFWLRPPAAQWRRDCYPLVSGYHNDRNHCIEYNQILLNNKDQVLIVGCSPGLKLPCFSCADSYDVWWDIHVYSS